MQAFTPLINLFALLTALSIAAERITNIVKLRQPHLREASSDKGQEKDREWSRPTSSRSWPTWMLREHLSQDHDLASRRSAKIDAQVEWLDREILSPHSSVLDLGCGPGFYTSRLAALGHSCLGIDFSPSSIEYARSEATAASLDCTYVLADLSEADFGSGFDAALLLYGEFNTFPRHEAEQLLAKARDALKPGGCLVLELHTEEQVRLMHAQTPGVAW